MIVLNFRLYMFELRRLLVCLSIWLAVLNEYIQVNIEYLMLILQACLNIVF